MSPPGRPKGELAPEARSAQGSPMSAPPQSPARWTPPLLRSLQSRIVALFLLLMVLVQGGGFLLIGTAGVAGARQTVTDELATGERVFLRLLDQSAQRLAQGARVLSSDFAFREAISTGDRETIASVLRNRGDRI